MFFSFFYRPVGQTSPKAAPKSGPLKTKKAPLPPTVPKRTENLPSAPPIKSPKPTLTIVTSSPGNIVEPSPTASKPETPTISKLYPDISRFADADDSPTPALAGFEPTVLPVPYNPSFPLTTAPEKVTAPRGPVSPLPAARRRAGNNSSGVSGLKDETLYPTIVRDNSARTSVNEEFNFKTAVSPGPSRNTQNHPQTAGSMNPPQTAGSLNPPQTAGSMNPAQTAGSMNPAEQGSGHGPSVNGFEAESNGALNGAGDSLQNSSRPDRPPLPPKRFSADTTYL